MYICWLIYAFLYRSGKAFASHAGRDRPKSLKQVHVVTAQLPSARQQVSQNLEDDHYKGLVRVTVGVAR